MNTDPNGQALPAPDGFEWVEVGAMCTTDPERPWVLAYAHPVGWWDGRPYGAVCRGDHPLSVRRTAWERLYVLRPAVLSGGRGQ